MNKKEKQKAKKPPVRERWNKYTAELKAAYNAGYKDGYSAFEKIADTRGARFAVKRGFGAGVKAHKKVNKYQNKAR